MLSWRTWALFCEYGRVIEVLIKGVTWSNLYVTKIHLYQWFSAAGSYQLPKQMILKISGILPANWHVSNLKSVIMGIFTEWMSTNATNWSLFPPTEPVVKHLPRHNCQGSLWQVDWRMKIGLREANAIIKKSDIEARIKEMAMGMENSILFW